MQNYNSTVAIATNFPWLPLSFTYGCSLRLYDFVEKVEKVEGIFGGIVSQPWLEA